jgi:predicted XRE-type DNA-binding protein
MDKEQKVALEAAGYKVGDAKDFLGLSEEESRIVEMRLALTRGIRNLRQKKHLTQHQLGQILHSSQSRVAKMEAGASDVSLDLIIRGYLAVGGDIVLKERKASKTRQSQKNLPRNSVANGN